MKKRERLLSLIAEIQEEINHLKEIEKDLLETEKRRKKAPAEDRHFFLESEAFKLHNFYTGCERIFEKIGTEIDAGLPEGADWHRRLLKKMALDIPEVRPPVISKQLEAELGEYLRFRHIVRNLYAFELEEEKMSPLIRDIGRVARNFFLEVRKFTHYLKTLSEGISGR